jgi:hypothetical protein
MPGISGVGGAIAALALGIGAGVAGDSLEGARLPTDGGVLLAVVTGVGPLGMDGTGVDTLDPQPTTERTRPATSTPAARRPGISR